MNHVVEIGRWVKNLEVKPAGSTVVAEGTLAVDRKVSKGKEKEADFFTVVLFGAMAENTAKFCGNKGDLISISGHLQSGKYEDKNKIIHYTTKIIADETQWLNFKNSNTEKPQNKAEYEAEMTPVDDGELPF